MGHLKDGKWSSGNVATSDDSGEFDREESSFRDEIKAGTRFPPEKDRYHLYVSYACPWAHRTLITLHLKGLEDSIGVSVVSPDMLEHSWTFDTNFPHTTGDLINDKKYLYEVYKLHDDRATCKVTVPVLWDKKTNAIVNNESSEIIRFLNDRFNEYAKNEIDLYPSKYREEIDAINDKVYHGINNGVYKTGFAQNQEAYEKSFNDLFKTLDYLENYLEGRTFLVADMLTEADIRLITTLLRFDSVYHGHFKCNKKMIRDYDHLSKYLERLYNIKAVKNTTNFEHIKRHYYYSHEFLNPKRIVPLGPELNVVTPAK